MKILKCSLGIAMVLAFAGCATQAKIVVNEPVGPDLAHPHAAVEANRGRLVVFTATQVSDQVNAYFPTHTPYSIYSPDGKLVRRVDNRSGSFYQDPSPLSLPPGKYKIEGHATNAGEVTIPIVIEEKKTTVVDLEGTHFPQHKPTGAGQWVRLPNGLVVGMKME